MLKPTFPIPGLLFSGQGRGALNFLTARSGLLICALFLLVGLALVGDYGIGADQATQRLIAEANVNYIRGRADGILVFNGRDALVPSDRFYGIAFELPLLLAERALGWEDLHYVNRLRLTLTHLFFIVGAFFFYRLAYRLFRNRPLAILALLLFLLHPRIYAHSFVNSKDLPFLSMFVLALYLLERAFRRDTLGAFVLLGIAVGLLTNLRIMGVMLLAAALAMRGLDLFYATSGPERKGILLTGGMFALAAGLTWYAVTPYAWPDPLDYLAGSLDLTVNHPTVVSVLFQGQRIPSDQLPFHYLPTWFLITAPPFMPLLGLCGAAVVVARGCRRPGAAFRNGRRRFAGLLLAAALLPALAAALLGSNQYDDWRHLYFSYAPLCLLAAGGMGGLTAALARQRRQFRVGMYGLAGLGFGLILLQMVQLHPLQHIYFNFLVDRTTPEGLRTQYAMDYWRAAPGPALQYLLELYPGETMAVRTESRDLWGALPPAARRRLPLAGGHSADYFLTHQPDSSKPDLFFNSAYPRRFYNNTLAVLRPREGDRMTAAARAAYQELYRHALAGEPIIRGNYDVYFKDGRLAFVRENCRPERREVWFTVRVFPPHQEILPLGLWEPGSSAAYSSQPVRVGAVCLAVIQLPAATQGELILSQRGSGPPGPGDESVWLDELYSITRPGLRERVDPWRQRQSPADPEAFAVFLGRDDAGRPGLLYSKGECSPADFASRIFLHIYPEKLADLPFYQWADGQENRDFPMARYGIQPGGGCLALVPLPEYPIAALHTGAAGIWEINLYPSAAPERLRANYAALSDRQPQIRAAFALYIQDNRLIYLRESCAAADTAAAFFLHILPQDRSDLPPERQAAGFANQDFVFDRRGGHFDGKCLAAIPLPPYPIKTIRTGQFQAGHGELWAAELRVGK